MGDDGISYIKSLMEVKSEVERNKRETEKIKLIFKEYSRNFYQLSQMLFDGEAMTNLAPKSQLTDMSLKKATCKQVIYNPAVILQICLPRAKSQDAVLWKVRNGESTVFVKAGEKPIGKNSFISAYLPSEWFPRLVMLFINMDIYINGKQDIYIGHSINEFFKKLGLSRQDNNYRIFRRNIEKLLYCGFSSSCDEKIVNLSSKIDIWKEEEKGSRKCYIHLSDDMYRNIIENPLPVDMSIVKKLKTCSLKLDVYAILLEWSQRITQEKLEIIEWDTIAELLGTNQSDLRQFYRDKLKPALKYVSALCSNPPQIEYGKSGLTVRVRATLSNDKQAITKLELTR